MSYETADILDAAADVIERDGWFAADRHGRTEHYSEGPQAACALVALDRVGGLHHDAAGSLARVIGGSSRWNPGGDVVAWNNAPERTKQEVLDAFRLAAKQERIAADGSVA